MHELSNRDQTDVFIILVHLSCLDYLLIYHVVKLCSSIFSNVNTIFIILLLEYYLDANYLERWLDTKMVSTILMLQIYTIKCSQKAERLDSCVNFLIVCANKAQIKTVIMVTVHFQ